MSDVDELRLLKAKIEKEIEKLENEIRINQKDNLIPCSFCRNLIPNRGKFNSLCPKCNSIT
jgi:Zn finger protein HypA/HybF involved in hydrogenase expression